jgi:hypothetical protein
MRDLGSPTREALAASARAALCEAVGIRAQIACECALGDAGEMVLA